MSNARPKKQRKREADYLRQNRRATLTPRQQRRLARKLNHDLAVAR